MRTPGGNVTAAQVVVATHYPFLDRSLAFARVHPQRSYAIACRIAGSPPEGMFISADSPTRSIRSVPLDTGAQGAGGEELLLVGGEGHRPGAGGDTELRYARLEAFARAHWDVRSVDFRWSAQDNLTLDGVPYVGRMTPRGERVLMATGFAKWGMTGGTAAAMLLADLLLRRQHPWAEFFDPNRLTHLGCRVRFNTAERSWDCPCHGSRFTPAGEVLQGPAVHRLERKPIDHS